MENLFLFIAILGLSISTPDVDQVRNEYQYASETNEKAKAFYKKLSVVKKTDDPVLVAYRGASEAIMAKFAKGVKSKIKFFKEGRDFLEFAILKDPTNTELRYLRLSVQENAPGIVGYGGDIKKDKQHILDHYHAITNEEVKKHIKGFVAQSTEFSEAEKEQF